MFNIIKIMKYNLGLKGELTLHIFKIKISGIIKKEILKERGIYEININGSDKSA